MNWDLISEAIGEHIHKIILWAKDSTKRFVIFLLILVFFLFNLLPQFITFLSKVRLDLLFTTTFDWIFYKSTTKEFITSLTVIVVALTILFIYYIFSRAKKVFEIVIDKHTDLWSYYKGSGWTIVDDKDSWTKVLKLTSCEYPAILKFGSDWINYKFSFETKIPSSVPSSNRNFTFVVRAKDKGNNVFFQCKPNGLIRPHFLTNGLFLIDESNEIRFPAEYETDKWFKVSVNVKGEEIIINMLGAATSYKIPTMRLSLPNQKISLVMKLADAITLDKDYQKQRESDEKSESTNKTPTALAFDLDYEKGTVGFRESGAETAFFRNIKIELLQPIYK